jgi:hypothetical protein
MRQKDLSAALQISPQQLSELLAGRSKSTGSTALKILDFLNTKTFMIPTSETPIDAHNGRPNTLQEAREMVDLLRAELKLQSGRGHLPRTAQPNLPPPKVAAPQGDPKPFKPESDPAFKKVEVAPVPKPKGLPASADTPYLINELLKTVSLPDLISMLGNPEISDLQRSCVYMAIKEIRAIEAGRC